MNDSLPSAEHPQLVGLCDAASALNMPLTTTQAEQLLAYLDLFGRWNQTHNLSAVRNPAAMLSHHLADCLAVLPPIRQHLQGRAEVRLLDVGSGGGLPGVVLAIAQPAWQVTCVDAVGKKCAFIRQVAGSLGLRNLSAAHNRVELLAPARADIVVSRAFASLADFTRLTVRHLGPDGVWLAMKGKAPTEEIQELASTVDVFHVEQLQVPGLNADRCLVWMRPVKT